MKKILEVVVVAAAFALGLIVLRQWRSRAAAVAHPASSAVATRPGSDIEGGPPASPRAAQAGSVTELPMIMLTTQPRSPRRNGSVPAPAKP